MITLGGSGSGQCFQEGDCPITYMNLPELIPVYMLLSSRFPRHPCLSELYTEYSLCRYMCYLDRKLCFVRPTDEGLLRVLSFELVDKHQRRTSCG